MSVHPSVLPYVRYASLKIAIFGTTHVTYQIEHCLVCFEVVLYVCPSLHLSFHTSGMSFAKVITRKDIGRIIARSGMFLSPQDLDLARALDPRNTLWLLMKSWSILSPKKLANQPLISCCMVLLWVARYLSSAPLRSAPKNSFFTILSMPSLM